MKNILIILLVVFFYSNTANGQWYNKSCGVIDINTCSMEEFNCMWNKASKTAHRGAVTTIIGSSIIGAGGVIALIGGSEEAVWTGLFFVMTGGFIDIIGVPIWIVGAARKSNLKKSPYYQDLNLGSLNITPAFGVNHANNSHYIGIGISLSF